MQAIIVNYIIMHNAKAIDCHRRGGRQAAMICRTWSTSTAYCSTDRKLVSVATTMLAMFPRGLQGYRLPQISPTLCVCVCMMVMVYLLVVVFPISYGRHWVWPASLQKRLRRRTLHLWGGQWIQGKFLLAHWVRRSHLIAYPLLVNHGGTCGHQTSKSTIIHIANPSSIIPYFDLPDQSIKTAPN